MRVLICEDNPKMRELLKIFLSGAAEICECTDGDEVLTAFSAKKPDWVVMDVRMKRVGGIAAAKLLRREFPAAQIVMLSKHDDAELRTAAREAGASGYLLKDDLTRLRRFLLKNHFNEELPK